MRLLVFTQIMDKNDPFLGFFHHWVTEFSKKFESILVVALKVGEHDLPGNVRVLSLGKESGESRIKYVKNFFAHIFRERKSYDSVFVHMNQEYVLLGGLVWKLLGKKVYLWRNHHAGSIATDIAAAFCDHVFCPSRYSYTAKYAKTIFMSVGIDTEIFKRNTAIARETGSILFLSRIAPVKKPHILLEALGILKSKGIAFRASLYGNPLPKDVAYLESLKQKAGELGIAEHVAFYKGIPHRETIDIYNAHEIFVNLSSSGMYDKTIFEAMACETLTLASNKNLQGLINSAFIFEEDNVQELASKLERTLVAHEEEKNMARHSMRRIVVEKHSLGELSSKLADIIR